MKHARCRAQMSEQAQWGFILTFAGLAFVYLVSVVALRRINRGPKGA